MRVGYVRVSTVEQNEERQIIELREKAGVEKFLDDEPKIAVALLKLYENLAES